MERSVHIMIVDDDADDVMFLKDAFTRHLGQGVVFTEAPTGDRALAILHQISAAAPKQSAALPHVIFLDLYMPGKSGYHTLIDLKAANSLAHIPVIVLTASILATEQQQCLAAGCVQYINKPLSVTAYDHTVAEAIGQFT